MTSNTEGLRLALALDVGGLGLEHLADLPLQLGSVLVAVYVLGVLGGGRHDLVLLADDRQRAIAFALEATTVSHHSAHLRPPVWWCRQGIPWACMVYTGARGPVKGWGGE